MHPSRLNDYTFPSTHHHAAGGGVTQAAAAGGPAQPPSSAGAAGGQQHGPSGSSGYALASGSRPTYVRRRSAQQAPTYHHPQQQQQQQQTPSGLVAASHASATTPRSATFPQPIFDPDSPFSQPPQGRTTVSPEKQRHPGPSVLRSPEPDGESAYWGEDALGTPWATTTTTRTLPKARLEDVAESLAQKGDAAAGEGDPSAGFLPEEGYVGNDVFDGGYQPIAAIRRERGRGRAVLLDVPPPPPPAPEIHDSQVYLHHSHQAVHPHQYHHHEPEPPAAYVPVAGPSSGASRIYPQHQPPVHHRGQSDDLHNRHPYRPAPTTPASYYVPTLQTMALAPPSPGALAGSGHYQPPRVISPLPGGGDWGQFVHAELFEEGNSQEEIVPFGGQEGASVAEHEHAHPPLPPQHQQPHAQTRTSSAHAFHHPRPRPVMSAHDLEPTPILEPHSDTSPTFSLSSRSQPGTPASFGVPDYADQHQPHHHHLSAAAPSSYASSSSGGGGGSISQFQFASAQPYNPATLDSFNPAQMHLPPSSFTFTSAAPPPPTTRVPDYRSHRRIKSIESVMSDYGPLAGGQPDHETIPEEYDDSFGQSDLHGGGGPAGGKDDYALNDLVKQVHLQHGGQSLYRARTESASRPSTASRAPSPMDSYRAISAEQHSPYAEQRPYPHPPPSMPYGHTAVYPPHHAMGTPVILVPHGQPPPPGMVPIHKTSYPGDPGSHPSPAGHYLQPHASLPIAPSPGYQPTFSGSTSPYSVHSPVMGLTGQSEAGSSHYALSPVLAAVPPPPPAAPPAAPTKETLAARRRSNRRGGSLSISTSKDAGALQPLSFSTSNLSASTSSAFRQDPLAESVHYHPYSRPSSSQPASSSAAPSSGAGRTPAGASKKRQSIGGATPKRTPSLSASATSRAVDKSAMAALIETLYEPLDAENAGSESASPPAALDYDTATGGKGKGKEELKFRCLVEDCDRAFPRRSAIIHHIQMHLSDKPFVCPVPDWYVGLAWLHPFTTQSTDPTRALLSQRCLLRPAARPPSARAHPQRD